MVSYKDWIWALCLLLIHPLLSLSVRAAFHLLQRPPDLSTFLNSNDLVSFAEPHPPPCPAYPFLASHLPLHSLCFLCFCPLLNSIFFSPLLVISSVLPDLPLPLSCLPLPSLVLCSRPMFGPDPPPFLLFPPLKNETYFHVYIHIHL